MNLFIIAIGIIFLLGTLSDVLETIILPRSVQRGFRFAPFILRSVWSAITPIASRIRRSHGTEASSPAMRLRQSLLMTTAPISMISLIGLWAAGLIIGFAFIQWGLGTVWEGKVGDHGLPLNLYVSGVNFFTLGLGDVTTNSSIGRILCVLEAGTGFTFLGLVIGYIPVFYNAFSRREVAMVLLDSKAGSNSSATELLRRYAQAGVIDQLPALLKEYERWSAELLESYLSYPVLAFYRSQHDDQSWLKTMTTILDVCALIEVGFAEEVPAQNELRFQARATFAMARHVIVDLCYVINIAPDRHAEDRLPAKRRREMRELLARFGLPLRDDLIADRKLLELRQTYEPYVSAIARRIIVDLPEWKLDRRSVDNWQTSAWDGMRHMD